MRWCGFVVLVLHAAAAAQERPLNSEELERAARYVVSGRVAHVYTTEKPLENGDSDSLFAIEIVVAKVLKVEGPGEGKTIFVRAWRTGKRPAGWKGPAGHTDIPARGDLVELYLSGGADGFDAVYPNGIQIVLPGTRKSKALGLEMVLVPAGTLWMGSPAAEPGRHSDEFEHRVRLTRPFYIGTYEVTQAEYKAVMAASPSWFASTGGGHDKVTGLATDRFPVEQVTWFDAVAFCNQLSQKDGFDPYYRLEPATRDGDSIKSGTVAILGGSGYRLPTEAEWEYACRAGTDTAFHFGPEQLTGKESNLRAVQVGAGYGTVPKWPELMRTTKVGSCPPSSWGLYDMHGNAAEWCWNWYDKHFAPESTRADPIGPKDGLHRTVRGGSWLTGAAIARSASRFWHVPDERNYHTGFRVARTP